jgi:hypothetical protein
LNGYVEAIALQMKPILNLRLFLTAITQSLKAAVTNLMQSLNVPERDVANQAGNAVMRAYEFFNGGGIASHGKLVGWSPNLVLGINQDDKGGLMNKKITQRKLAVSVALLSVLILHTGCALPNLKPFADATATLDTGVREGGRQIIEAMKEFPFKKNGKIIPITDEQHPANRLTKAWAIRTQAMDALIAYSASLANISNAGINAKNNVEAFGNTVEGLAKYIPTASAYTGDVKDLISLITKTGIEIQSYRTLSKAVESAKKPLADIVTLIYDDLGDLLKISKNLRRKGLANLRKPAEQVLVKYNGAEKLKKKWLDQLSVPANEVAALNMVKKYDDVLQNLLPEVQAHQETIANFNKKCDNLDALLSSTQKALASWKIANAQLAQALKDRRQPNIALFVIRAAEIKNAVDKLRD